MARFDRAVAESAERAQAESRRQLRYFKRAISSMLRTGQPVFIRVFGRVIELRDRGKYEELVHSDRVFQEDDDDESIG